MINLKEKPFYLDDKGCEWVKNTLAGMDDKAKVGQLFCEILWDRPGSEPESLFDFIEPGGVMYRPFPGKKMHEFSKRLQAKAKIDVYKRQSQRDAGMGADQQLYRL